MGEVARFSGCGRESEGGRSDGLGQTVMRTEEEGCFWRPK